MVSAERGSAAPHPPRARSFPSLPPTMYSSPLHTSGDGSGGWGNAKKLPHPACGQREACGFSKAAAATALAALTRAEPLPLPEPQTASLDWAYRSPQDIFAKKAFVVFFFSHLQDL